MSSRSDVQQATLPSFSEVLQQLSSLFTRENLVQAANKVVNLYLPVAYTYITYRAPFLTQIGSFIASSSLFQSLRKAITERISGDCCPDKKTDTPAAGSGAEKKDDDLISSGKKVIDTIVDKTIAGQVYKRLTGQSRSKTIELGGTRPTESKTPPPTPSPTAGEAENSSSSSSSSSSEGRKVIFPSDTLSLPSPAITVRLEDRGPEGWKEKIDPNVNKESSTAVTRL